MNRVHNLASAFNLRLKLNSILFGNSALFVCLCVCVNHMNFIHEFSHRRTQFSMRNNLLLNCSFTYVFYRKYKLCERTTAHTHFTIQIMFLGITATYFVRLPWQLHIGICTPRMVARWQFYNNTSAHTHDILSSHTWLIHFTVAVQSHTHIVVQT